MPHEMQGPQQPLADLLNAGREALASGQREKARERFQAALAKGETPEALEGLAEAAWWLHDEETTLRFYKLAP